MKDWFKAWGEYQPLRDKWSEIVNDPSGRAVLIADILPVAEQFITEYPTCPYSAMDLAKQILS